MTRAGKKKRARKKWKYRMTLSDGTRLKDIVTGFFTSYRLKKALLRAYPGCTIVSLKEIPR